MRSIFFACVLVLLQFCCCSGSYQPSTLPDVGDPKFIEECVQTHNRFRSGVNPPASNMLYMSWDPDLAKTANAWAKKCLFKHNTHIREPGQAHPKFTAVGENLWTGSLSVFTVQGAIAAWYKEVNAYDYATRKCKAVCGHYTQVPVVYGWHQERASALLLHSEHPQEPEDCPVFPELAPNWQNQKGPGLTFEVVEVVWATSYKVGCAVHFCPKIAESSMTNVAHFICNYAPVGNYPVHPYKTGAACSDCNGEQCASKLCKNAERDKVVSDPNWYPEWDKSTFDKYCITVVVLRLSLLILTILAAWLLPKCRPVAPASE